MAAPHSGWSLDCKVYIGGLGADADKQALEKAFARYGVITNFWVARNPPGFAFVEYELPSDAEDAVRGLNGIVFEGRRLRVEMSTGKSRREVRPWYKAGDDYYKYSSRSRTRSRSRSRYSSRSSRSWSRGRSRRRTRSGSSRYRYRHYSSSSRWSSASSRRRSRTPSLRRKRHYSSSGSYYSRSPGRSVSPRRRGRSRKRSGSSPKEAIRSRSKTRRSRSSSDSRIRDASVPPDDDSVDLSRTMVVDETCSDKVDDPEEYIERNVDDRISVAVQTDYFLLLYFIEKAPDVMTETFLRVDRDKVLNSSNLPEIIPTVYRLPRRGIRDIRRSSNVQVNVKKRSGGQVKTKTTASKAKSKASSSDEMITKDDKAMEVDDGRNARDQRPKKQGFAVSETSKANCSNHVDDEGSDIDADKGGNKLGSPPLKDKRLDTPATDSAISSSPRQDHSKRNQDPEEKDKNLSVSRDQRECKDKDGKKLKQGNTVFEEIERRKKGNKEGIQKHQKEDKHSECEHSDGDMKSVEKTDKRSNAERKDRIKFQVRQQRAMILSERRDPGQGRNGQSKFDRLREKPDSSSDDDFSSDSASSRKKPRLAKEPMPSSPNNKSDVLMEGNDALPEKKGSNP